MYKPLTWTWKSLLASGIPVSMRRNRSTATRTLKFANKVAVVTGSTKGSPGLEFPGPPDLRNMMDLGVSTRERQRILPFDPFCVVHAPHFLTVGLCVFNSFTETMNPQSLEEVILLSRIGLAAARRLAQDGAHVVICSRKQQNVDHAMTMLQDEGLSVTGTVCHVGKAEDRERLVAKALEYNKGVDFLVCVAGVNPLVGSTLGTSEQIWDKILNVNVKSPALLLSQLLPHMENRGQGSVILVSSVTAYSPVVDLGVYNISKTAILGLTKTLAKELAPKNIRVNCIVPGLIKTEFSQILSEMPAIWNTAKEKGIQRVGVPEDCSGLVSFLCSPDAGYISGEIIAVAGFSPHL